MSADLPPLLIVDDERNMRLSLETVMRGEGYQIAAVESAEEGLKWLKKERCFLVLTDARLGGMSGYDFLRAIGSQWAQLPVIMITAYATPKLAVEAIKAGAIDYLAKPFAPEELLHAVARCAERYRLLSENSDLKEKAQAEFSLDRIIGDCPQIQELRRLIKTVGPTNATVLILGESGTGKELIAGAIHGVSKRRDKNYVRINCAAIPEQLLESELFGHEKGAFTGAIKHKAGRVEEADGGTIFLDEIGDMSRPLQAKLLRFLEDGTFTRVGGNQELRVDVRLIAATNRDIIAAINAHQFREDLFHRLNVVQFTPPVLRGRGTDVHLLAGYFLKQFCLIMNKPIKGFSGSASRMLELHHWPGNIRELRNAVERAVILETKEEIQPSSLPDFRVESRLRKSAAGTDREPVSLQEQLHHFESKVIAMALAETQYRVPESAALLAVSEDHLRQRMGQLGMALEETQCARARGSTQ